MAVVNESSDDSTPFHLGSDGSLEESNDVTALAQPDTLP